MPKPTRQHDGIATIGQARANRDGTKCAVCGGYKQPGALLCSPCMARLDQVTRNRLGSCTEEFMDIVRELRKVRAAEGMGLRLRSV